MIAEAVRCTFNHKMDNLIVQCTVCLASPTHSLMALSTVSRGDVVSDTPSGQFSVTQSTISSAIGQAWALQAEIWLLIGQTTPHAETSTVCYFNVLTIPLVDIYLQLDRHEDATACHEEAKLIAPISAPVFYQVICQLTHTSHS